MKLLLIFVLFSSSVFSQTLEERKNILSQSDSKFLTDTRKELSDYRIAQSDSIKAYLSKYKFINSEHKSLQKFINGTPIFYTTDNAGSSLTIKANSMYPGGSLGLNVNGNGITCGVWDGGSVRASHVELTGRVMIGDSPASLSDHGTHVSGTIMASGVSPSRKGIAYSASLKSYDWEDDYLEMDVFSSAGFLVSNHSYGYVAENLPNSLFGKYDSTSRQMDLIAFGHPYYQIVTAAGNDRDGRAEQTNLKNGYDLLTGMSNSKNVISVAAVEEVVSYIDASSVVLGSFSNYGPSDDGRVKPDISAKGVNVSSSIATNNTAYATYNGTSMAAPAISGLIVLLQKHYNNLNSGKFMRAASVKGLLCHTTKECGFDIGPDYEYGWGLANGEEAAQLISQIGSNTVLEENTLSNGQTFTKSITLNSSQKLKVSICWTDPAAQTNTSSAEDSRIPSLMNNLDLKVIKDGNIYYPWKLNPNNPTDAATNDSENNVDNIEKVEIFDAQPGTYTIQVTHKGTLKDGNQDFTLIASGTSSLTLNSADFISDNTFFVYPNPATDVLNFTNTKNISLSKISINDITGKVVYESNDTLPENSIAISNLQQGVYFVKFTSDSKTYVKKFVKQ